MTERFTTRQKVILERIRDGLNPHIYPNSSRALNSLYERGYWEFRPNSSERVLTEKGRLRLPTPATEEDR